MVRGVLTVILVVALLPAHVRAEPASSCGGVWYRGDGVDSDGVCTFDLAGSPVTVSGSWTIDPDFLAGLPNPSVVKTDIHVEVLVRFGPPPWGQTFAPSWECVQEARPYAASCSATFRYGPDSVLPATAGPAVVLECHAHRHSPPSLPGSGEFKCSSGGS